MKTQILLAVLGLLAAYVSCAAVEPVQVGELATIEGAEEPVQIIESFEDFDLDDGSTGPVARSNTILLRGTFVRSAAANVVHVITVRYTGRAATRISSVLWRHLTSLGQTARITAGGANRNTVTVEIRSARGRGVNSQIEIWGRY